MPRASATSEPWADARATDLAGPRSRAVTVSPDGGVHIPAQGPGGSVDAMSVERPQYGEYATPEEQRARAGLPPVEQMPTASAPAPAPPVPQQPLAPTAPAARPASRAQVLITAVMLGVGMVNVLSSIPQFLNLSATLQQTLKLMGGEGTFSNFAVARTWGIIAVLVLVAGFAATVWLSVRRIRRGRSSWWVPLVGFAVTMVAVSICVSVPMFGDPAFTQSLLTPPAG